MRLYRYFGTHEYKTTDVMTIGGPEYYREDLLDHFAEGWSTTEAEAREEFASGTDFVPTEWSVYDKLTYKKPTSIDTGYDSLSLLSPVSSYDSDDTMAVCGHYAGGYRVIITKDGIFDASDLSRRVVAAKALEDDFAEFRQMYPEVVLDCVLYDNKHPEYNSEINELAVLDKLTYKQQCRADTIFTLKMIDMYLPRLGTIPFHRRRSYLENMLEFGYYRPKFTSSTRQFSKVEIPTVMHCSAFRDVDYYSACIFGYGYPTVLVRRNSDPYIRGKSTFVAEYKIPTKLLDCEIVEIRDAEMSVRHDELDTYGVVWIRTTALPDVDYHELVNHKHRYEKGRGTAIVELCMLSHKSTRRLVSYKENGKTPIVVV